MPRQHPREDGGFSAEGEQQQHPSNFPLQKCGLTIFILGWFCLGIKKFKKKKKRERGKKEWKKYASMEKAVGFWGVRPG